MKNKIQISDSVKKIAKILIDNGNQAFVVGGAVRDSIMNVNCKDIDIATDLHVEDVIELFKDLNITDSIKRTGDKFPVARIFTIDGHEYEIATFRSDEGEGEDTSFKIVSTIDGDVNRRDFTFNALFADALTGEIKDLVGGKKDLEDGIIRFVGDSVKRINEDRTRLLRLVRFSERFGFEIANFDSIKSNNVLRDRLSDKDKVKKEMIVNEVIKGFEQSKDKVSYFKTLSDLGLLEQIFPNLKVNIPHISFEDHIERLLVQVLWYNTSSDIEKCLKDMKWSNEIIDRIMCIITIKDHDLDSDFRGLSRFVKKIKSSESNVIFSSAFINILFNERRARFGNALLEFKLTVKREDFPKIPNGPKLGEAIHKKEMWWLRKIAKL